MKRPRLLLAACLAAATGACTAAAVTATIGTPQPTSVTVDPGDFLGGVACADTPGAMKSYVATLIDNSYVALGGDAAVSIPFALPSSPPTPCSQQVSFRAVVVGHEYTAEIDGYDVQPADVQPDGGIAPLGGPSSGARAMVIGGAGAPVAPRWTTHCAKPVTVTSDVAVPLVECSPLAPQGPAAAPGIEVDPGATLGMLACADGDGGTIAGFDVLPEGSALAAHPGVPCGTTVTFSQGITAGVTYTFQVVAHGQAIVPTTFHATCTATAREGLTVRATCDPLAFP